MLVVPGAALADVVQDAAARERIGAAVLADQGRLGLGDVLVAGRDVDRGRHADDGAVVVGRGVGVHFRWRWVVCGLWFVICVLD